MLALQLSCEVTCENRQIYVLLASGKVPLCICGELNVEKHVEKMVYNV